MKKTTRRPVQKLYDLSGKVAAITGGAGFLGIQHAEAIMEVGGTAVLLDVNETSLKKSRSHLAEIGSGKSHGVMADITRKADVEKALKEIIKKYGRLDILINNAGIDPKVSSDGISNKSRLEEYPLDQWNLELAVGLTGAFLCSQVMGTYMASHGGGVILNISSDLAAIAPDQRIYRKPGLAERLQPVKPVTYSVIKTGLIGLTRYLATYWTNVRANALSPGGAYNGQPEDFVKRLSDLIPLGRMAHPDEYKAAVVFLVSDASSYMTGANLAIDGGRTCW